MIFVQVYMEMKFEKVYTIYIDHLPDGADMVGSDCPRAA